MTWILSAGRSAAPLLVAIAIALLVSACQIPGAPRSEGARAVAAASALGTYCRELEADIAGAADPAHRRVELEVRRELLRQQIAALSPSVAELELVCEFERR